MYVSVPSCQQELVHATTFGALSRHIGLETAPEHDCSGTGST
jgi:hypothetical protein